MLGDNNEIICPNDKILTELCLSRGFFNFNSLNLAFNLKCKRYYFTDFFSWNNNFKMHRNPDQVTTTLVVMWQICQMDFFHKCCKLNWFLTSSFPPSSDNPVYANLKGKCCTMSKNDQRIYPSSCLGNWVGTDAGGKKFENRWGYSGGKSLRFPPEAPGRRRGRRRGGNSGVNPGVRIPGRKPPGIFRG